MWRRVAASTVVLLLAGVGSALTATTAAAGISTIITIDKVVIGTPPSGTTFTLNALCDDGQSGGPFTFDSHGNPTNSNEFDVGASGTTTCTITETAPDAVNPTAYTCVAESPATCTSPTSNSVVSTTSSAVATVTAINTYLPPLTVAPNPVTAGAQATVSGQLCTKQIFGGSPTTGGTVNVTIGFSPPINLTTTAGSNGSWSVGFTVPLAAVSGPYPVTATCSDPVPYPASVTTVIGAVVATPRFTG
jgi:hypothetical protein